MVKLPAKREMEKRMWITSPVFIFFVVLLLTACNSNTSDYSDIPNDSLTIAKGQLAFSQNCSACHNFRQNGIGPHLGGITRTVPSDWIKDFIKNPKALVDAGDERSQKLFARYKTMMPSFGHYSDQELTGIVAYLHTHEAPDTTGTVAGGPEELKNPIPGPIQQSDLVVDVEYVTQIPASAEKGFKTRITKLDYIPTSQRLFIVDIRGKLHEMQNNQSRVYLDMAQLKSKFIDKPGLATGFGSFAFHPEFLKNGLLYTSHTEPAGTVKAEFGYADSIEVALQWVVSEWKTEDPAAFPFKGKSRELFRIDMVTGMHGVQELTFNPNAKKGDEDYGLLYIGIGDGACVGSGYPFLVQNIEKPWGSILRIDPQGNNSRNKKYGIPATNPFIKHENDQALGEMYAYGFRNPHRITWSRSGQMLASNIGQTQIESVNLIMPGNNYGWPIREGTFLVRPFADIAKVYALPADDANYNITYPAAQYDHDEGLAISGGFEYTGTAVPQLQGKYLFADMNNGRLYYLDLADVKPGNITTIKEWKITFKGKQTSTAELCGSKRVDLRFGKDHKGDVYFFSKQDGKVWRLASANSPITGL
ncbi:MAG: PQQ-dependent sugar dehydrogenase [Cyclobacteriaceae bacterium]